MLLAETRTKRRKKSEYPGVSVYRRKDIGGQWTAQWRDPLTGKKHQTLLSSMGYATKTDAEGWLKELSERLTEAKRRKRLGFTATEIESDARKDMSLEDVLEAYEEDYGLRGEDLLAKERSRLTPLRQWLQGSGRGFTRCGDFSTLALFDYYDWLKKRKKKQPKTGRKHRGVYVDSPRELSPATRNAYRQAAISFLNWARRRHYISLSGSDISESFPKFQQESRLPRSAPAQELAALLNKAVELDQTFHQSSRQDKGAYKRGVESPTAKPRYAELTPLMLLLSLTGMRLGEALHLRWECVDERRGVIHIQADHSAGWKTKTRQERVIAMADSPALKRLLRELRNRPDKGRYVIRGNDPRKPWSFNRKVWNRIAERAGVRHLTPKLHRSTFATALASAQNGPNPYELSQRMGHSVQVAEKNYVGAVCRRKGRTVEAWLGITKEVNSALRAIRVRGQ